VTDFGRRAGLGDMLRSVYDTDASGVVDTAPAHKTTHHDGGTDEINVEGLGGELKDDQPPKNHALADNKHTAATLAELNSKISDATLDKDTDTRTPTAHKTTHQAGQSDPIDVTGLVGSTPRAVLGDATAGRVLRASRVFIANPSAPDCIQVSMLNSWNGDAISAETDLAKGGSTTSFALDADGKTLTIKGSALAGNAIGVVAAIICYNACETYMVVQGSISGNDIELLFRHANTGANLDLPALVDNNSFMVFLTYVTDA